MRRLLLAGGLLLLTLYLGQFHTYGFPGQTLNGGAVLAGYGLEVWGTPGFFIEDGV